MNPELKLTADECTGCGICADVCSFDAILMTDKMAFPLFIPEQCTLCLTCAEECPFEAIEIKEVSLKEKVS
ncbi:MAG: 4Fe-4S dicluster domain-containing protein [Calditrichaeota bacterium]|nr:4Fe-4S dicluster domain-containing protein [Calditrichota bacterium]